GAGDAEIPLPEVQLDVIHVVPRLFESDELPGNQAEIGPRLHRAVEDTLADAGPDVCVREKLVWGDERAAAEIVRYAERESVDLAVLGTHGYGALQRALIGSVASAVARTAPCPVLLVPPTRWRGEVAGGVGAGDAASVAVA
ncbi:MAG TPA: universal stress protein, partial [Longimicrobium sp.]|nr:universal stress protein [Longimicrobium sp.]